MDRLSALTILGLGDNYTQEELKKTFRQLSVKYHPDITGGDSTRFQEILAAYKFLLSPSSSRPIVLSHASIFIIKNV